MPIDSHTERSKSTWLVGSSALLVLRKDLGRVLLVNRFGIPYPSPRGNLQAAEIAADLVVEMSKQDLDAVWPWRNLLGNIFSTLLVLPYFSRL